MPWFGLGLGFGLRLKAGIEMDETRQGKARHEKTVHDKLRQDEISQGKTKKDDPRLDKNG